MQLSSTPTLRTIITAHRKPRPATMTPDTSPSPPTRSPNADPSPARRAPCTTGCIEGIASGIEPATGKIASTASPRSRPPISRARLWCAVPRRGMVPPVILGSAAWAARGAEGIAGRVGAGILAMSPGKAPRNAVQGRQQHGHLRPRRSRRRRPGHVQAAHLGPTLGDIERDHDPTPDGAGDDRHEAGGRLGPTRHQPSRFVGAMTARTAYRRVPLPSPAPDPPPTQRAHTTVTSSTTATADHHRTARQLPKHLARRDPLHALVPQCNNPHVETRPRRDSVRLRRRGIFGTGWRP